MDKLPDSATPLEWLPMQGFIIFASTLIPQSDNHGSNAIVGEFREHRKQQQTNDYDHQETIKI
jgi:hypothetical protein